MTFDTRMINRNIAPILLALLPLVARAERVAPSDAYLHQLRQELTQFMALSDFYWPVLVVSFLMALSMVYRIAKRKDVRIASSLFILPAAGFLVFILLFTALRTMLAEWVVDLAGWSGDFLTWAKPVFLLGSEWYAGVIIALVWFVTHPLLLKFKEPRTKSKVLLAFCPSILLAGAVLLWLYTGFFVGFLMYI